MATFILGISAFYHDSAAALIRDGEIIAAAQEERFTRVKADARFPSAAIRYCLEQGAISATELDHVVFYEKPLSKFERLLETYLAFLGKTQVAYVRRDCALAARISQPALLCESSRGTCRECFLPLSL